MDAAPTTDAGEANALRRPRWVSIGLWGFPIVDSVWAFFWLWLGLSDGWLDPDFQGSWILMGGIIGFLGLWRYCAVRWQSKQQHRDQRKGIRLWVVGIPLIAGGFTHGMVFELAMRRYAGRIEMGFAACCEAFLFGAGFFLLGVARVDSTEPGRERDRPPGRAVWFVVMLFAAYAVLRRMPP